MKAKKTVAMKPGKGGAPRGFLPRPVSPGLIQRALAGAAEARYAVPVGGPRHLGGGPTLARPPASLIQRANATSAVTPVGKPDVQNAPPATGPYQGAAGTEGAHPGQQRVPTADWATPGANYERRNYYVSPKDGSIIAREPGYYNPENPWDTGRPGESNGEFARTYGYGADAIAPYERRMDEPGVTPWGPGGKASAPGKFDAPGAGVSHPHQGGVDLAKALLGGPQTATGIDQGQDLLGGAGGEESPNEYLMQLLRGLLGKVPGAPSNAQ